MKKLLICFLGYVSICCGQTKILFDATKAETAGNADWVIDADQHNLDWNPGAILNAGNESNAQAIPTPSQTSITASSAETLWEGALSNWGVDLVKKGYQVQSLAYNQQITYGNTSNSKDLSNYKVFVVCEPNILYTASEKTALINFVFNGGGLFMISDHDQSDRNGDGQDSPHIWNDLMQSNSVQTNPFGMTFDYVNISQTSNNIANLPNDTILHGISGNNAVSEIMYSNGTTLTLNNSQNPSAKGIIYKSGSSNSGTLNCMVARANYGLGKVAALGDSSPCDDGTGDSNDVLYNGYTQDANGNHQKLLVNIVEWLAASNNTTTGIKNDVFEPESFIIYPNPSNGRFELYILPNQSNVNAISVYNAMGQISYKCSIPASSEPIRTSLELDAKGIYTLFVNDVPKRIVVK
jgi:hypothetical protein